jgi:hypothetical protein
LGYRNIRPTDLEPELPPDSRLIMWPQFLRISPSYFAAHLVKTSGARTEQFMGAFPCFDKVLETYDEFGSVFDLTMIDWWRANSVRLFSAGFALPLVKYMGFAYANEHVKVREFYEGLRNYVDISRPNMGSPAFVMLALPIGGNKVDVLNTVSEALDFYAELNRQHRTMRPAARYEINKDGNLSGKAFSGLQLSINLVMSRALNPNRYLWEYGYDVGVGRSSRKIIDSKMSSTDSVELAKKSLSQSTSKIFREALAIAESAARGQFPVVDIDSLPHTAEIDYKNIRPILEEFGTGVI